MLISPAQLKRCGRSHPPPRRFPAPIGAGSSLTRQQRPSRAGHMAPGASKQSSGSSSSGSSSGSAGFAKAAPATAAGPHEGDDDDDDATVFQLKRSDRLPADVHAEAAAAAEAAQRQLMASGQLAQAMQSSQVLQRVMSTHSQLQQLYHKAVAAILRRHGMLASTPAGVALAVFCELLGEPPTKQPSDSITLGELQQLKRRAQQLPEPDEGLLRFASTLLAQRCSLDGMLVMPDVQSVLVGEMNMSDVISSLTGSQSMLNDILGGLGEQLASMAARDEAVKLLLAATARGGQQHHGSMGSSMADAMRYQVVSIRAAAALAQSALVWAALDTLSDTEDRLQIAALDVEFCTWAAATTGCPTACDATRTPSWLCTARLLASFACTLAISTMRETALQQLAGDRPVGDWAPVRQALDLLEMPMDALVGTRGLSVDWLADNRQLLHGLIGRVDSVGLSVNPTWGIASAVGVLEGAAILRRSSGSRANGFILITHVTEAASLAELLYMQTSMRGFEPFIDAHDSCSSLLFFWADILQLSLQMAGGQPGPDAVAAAEQLMQEKQSVFLARTVLRLLNVLFPAQLSSPASTVESFCMAPLSLSPGMRHMVLARGDAKAAASLAAFERAQPGSSSAMQQRALTACDHEAAQPPVAGAGQLSEQLAAILTGAGAGIAPKQLGKQLVQLLAAASVPAGQQQQQQQQLFDRGMVAAMQDHLQQVVSLAVTQVKNDGSWQLVQQQHVWLVAALAQLRVREAASSPAMAELLLGEGAVAPEFLRPVSEFFQAKQAAAGVLADTVCQLGWRLSPAVADPQLGLSTLLCYAQPGRPNRLESLLWLVAAALCGSNIMAAQLAVQGLENARKTHDCSQLPDPAFEQVVCLAWHGLALAAGQPAVINAADNLQLLLSNKPFQQQQPAVQAVMQAMMQQLVAAVSKDPNQRQLAAVVSAVELVPLLHASDYNSLLAAVLERGSVQQVAAVWQAAVAAATNQQLVQQPASGGQRPNAAWLAEQLPRVVAEGAAVPGLADSIMRPAFAAAMQLATAAAEEQAAATAAADSSGATADSLLLLDGMCCALATADYSAVQLPVMQGVLNLLLQPAQQQAPPAFASALCTVAAVGAAHGDLTLYRQALQHVQQLQLSAADVAAVRAAALAAAADATAARSQAHSKAALLQLWSDAVSQDPAAALPPAATKAVVAALQRDQGLTEQLLAAGAVPAALLEGLLQAAVDSDAKAVTRQLLQHAKQSGCLEQLPTELLVETGGFSQQLLGVVLQRGSTPSAAAAAGLLDSLPADSASAAHPEWQQLLQWLGAQCSTAPPAAAHSFLCSLMQHAAAVMSAEHAWQLFQVFEACRQQGGWPAAQQALPAAACSAVLAALSQDAADRPRLLHVWQHAHTPPGELPSSSLQLLLRNLVAAGQASQALQLAQQQPPLLKQLADLWQQQAEPSVPAEALLGALRVAVAQQPSTDGADAVAQLLWLLQQQEGDAWQQQLGATLAVQALELLCAHGRLANSQLLLALMSSRASDTDALPLAAAGVAAFASAAAQEPPPGLRQQAVQGLADATAAAGPATQQLLLEAVGVLLQRPAVAAGPAVALLLELLATPASKGPQQLLPELLAPAQWEQVVSLCCAPASRQAAPGLPSSGQLAAQCVAADGACLSAAAAAQLINALAEQPGLQPGRAAVLLGLVAEADLLAASGDNSSSSRQAPTGAESQLDAAAVADAMQLIAQLCAGQAAAAAAEDDTDALVDAVQPMVAALTHEGAAAALFAVWHCAHQQPAAAAAAVGPHGALRSRAAAGRVCGVLYRAARQGKPSLDSLLLSLDLALAAAADARDWKAGLDVMHTAERRMSANAGSSSGRAGQRSDAPAATAWLPLLPAAAAAVPAVLVHEEGVEMASQQLLQRWKQMLDGQKQAPAAAVGRKAGRAASAAAVPSSSAVSASRQPLSLAAVKSFFAAAVDVSRSAAQQAADDEATAAAQAAAQAAEVLFVGPLMAVQVSAAISTASGSASALLQPDAECWALLAEVFGAAGDWQRVSQIAITAAQQQLPMEPQQPQEAAEQLQVVLAGVASAWLAAGGGREGLVVALLDGLAAAGVTQLTNPQLAAHLLAAANTHDEALAERLAGGLEAVYGDELANLAAAAAAAATPAVPVVGVPLAAAADEPAALLKQLARAISSKQ